MEAIWNGIHKWAVSSGLDAAGAKMLASALCSTAVICMALALCATLSFVSRRFIPRSKGSRSCDSKLTALIRTVSWTIFTWILYAWLPGAFNKTPVVMRPLSQCLYILTVMLFASTLSSAITWINALAGSRARGQAFASKTISQTAKILLWFTAAIIVISALMGKSPTFVLSGLGALTAVLMLIFRDSILGLVAGIQISQNDMVRVGDWITMPKYNADGNVIDIALTTVKVQNFDNTVTMIPSSALISDAFVNWRYMSVSKGRRIKRPVWISVMSIKEITPEMKDSLVEQGLLEKEDSPVSNLAAFEIWLRRMLKANDDITKELTCMVRQTEAEDTGIPVEVYAFTKTRDWEEYENIQTGIFDNIFVTVPKFGLQIYQRTGDKPLLGK